MNKIQQMDEIMDRLGESMPEQDVYRAFYGLSAQQIADKVDAWFPGEENDDVPF